jgi:pSer/pThr/pTyr-binding forkhead associated (FHA) protein
VDEPLAVALKFGFLAVLYLFLLWVARSAMRDLARDPSAAPADGPDAPGGNGREDVRPRLEVVAALGYEPGSLFDISGGANMGRSETSNIPVDDPYASSSHARIFPRDGVMYIEDMGSTNGTYLNGKQLKRSERLRPGDSVRIGDTEYRYQE